MFDGSLYLMVNRQGGPAGGRGFAAPNWWMGMATRKAGPGITARTRFSRGATVD